MCVTCCGAQAGPNEQIKLVGNNKKLGKWDMDDAPHMKFNPETGLWSFATRIPVATTLEYKFVLITATGAWLCVKTPCGHHNTCCAVHATVAGLARTNIKGVC